MNLKKYLRDFALGKFSRRFPGHFSLSMLRETGPHCNVAEAHYQTVDGRQIPVFPDYRYRLKEGWRYYRSLDALARLNHQSVLSEDEKSYLVRVKGTRTLAEFPESIRDFVVNNVVARLPERFLESDPSDPLGPLLKPDKMEAQERCLAFSRKHRSMFEKLDALGVFSVNPGMKLLEIGYITGAHSLFAFESFGLKVSGIDNDYSGLVGSSNLATHNRTLLDSRADLQYGDITRCTEFPAESFDIIYSGSVLEHLHQLQGAFAEMYRLLKPGGVMIHSYHPYFCHDGGHSLCIGDSPWMHVRLGNAEYEHYLKSQRPFEAKIACDWFKCALNREVPLWRMQRLVCAEGFRLSLWQAKSSATRWLDDLTPQLIEECLVSNPEICLDDLMTCEVFLVATKVLGNRSYPIPKPREELDA